MNTNQIKSLVRTIMVILGTVLTMRGIGTGEQWNSLGNLVMEAIGTGMGIWAIVWSFLHHGQVPPGGNSVPDPTFPKPNIK